MSSYDAGAGPFVKKALSNDDRDGDGLFTLDSCLMALRERCPLGLISRGFAPSYLQKNFGYVSDQDLYFSFDRAAYPRDAVTERR